jgi:hypothetical protein
MNIRITAWVCLLLACIMPAGAYAEQKQVFGDYEVHYIVLPTVSLNAEIAAKYGLPRGRNRSLVNISVLNLDGEAVPAQVSGRSANLLGQSQPLEFSEVREGPAIYYLALLRHANEEYHRVAIDVVLPNSSTAELRFQQQMFWEE